MGPGPSIVDVSFMFYEIITELGGKASLLLKVLDCVILQDLASISQDAVLFPPSLK